MMSRVQIARRIIVLQEAIDILNSQASRDGQGVYHCLGAMQVHMRHLEFELRMTEVARNVQTGGAA